MHLRIIRKTLHWIGERAMMAHGPDWKSEIHGPFEREGEPGVWAVEEIGYDGEIYQAIFKGPDAEHRCVEYRGRKYGWP